MSFQEAFPELAVPAPQLAGQQSMAPSPLLRLRRQQLHDLARAFGIEVKPDGTKMEILPVLMDSEARGVFRGPPLDDYYLRKAARSADDHGGKLEGQPKSKQKAAAILPVETVETNYEPRPDQLHIGTLRKVAKLAGMRIMPMSKRQEMLDYLEAKEKREEENAAS